MLGKAEYIAAALAPLPASVLNYPVIYMDTCD